MALKVKRIEAGELGDSGRVGDSGYDTGRRLGCNAVAPSGGLVNL